MELEDYLSLTYTPLKTVKTLTEIIYQKCNEDWNMFSGENQRNNTEELLAINFAIKLCADYLLKFRQECLDKMCVFPSRSNRYICYK